MGPRESDKKPVKGKIFTPHVFISLVARTRSTPSWILGKSLLKPKKAHIYTKKGVKAHLIRGILGGVVWRANKYVQ